MRVIRLGALTAACIVFVAVLATPPSGGALRLPAVVKTASNFGAGWTTYHHDNARTGHDGTAAAIVSPNPSKTWNVPVDSLVYAEPLVWNGMVIAATENDSLYALDEGSGAVIWHVVAGTSVPTHYCSSEINPIGITSTPAIDTSTNIVYAVGLVTGPKYQLFARNLADGSNVSGFPVDITPNSQAGVLDPTVQEQRGALGLANGHVYIPFGGWLGDCGNYHPWVVSVPSSGGAVDHVYEPQTSFQREAGIWAAEGMAIDGSGNIYVATGNGGSTGFVPCDNNAWDHGNSVVKLSPTLAELDFFAPTNWCDLSRTDTDVGSIAPSLLINNILFQAGKSGQGWMVNITNMGHFGGERNTNTAISGCASGDSIFGGAAYVDPEVYLPCNSSGSLLALTVNTGTSPLGFATHWATSGFTPGPPIVEGGLIWTLNIGGSSIHAYDVNGNQVISTNLSSGVRHFSTPAADGDWIFVPQTTSITGLDFAPSSGPTCGANPCQVYTVDAYGGVDPDNFSPGITNQPHFGTPVARAGHFAPSGTAGVTPPQSGLVLDAYGGLHPYGSPALTPSQAPYYPGNDIARDFVWLPNGTGGYELDGYGGIHPFSIGANPLPPQPSQYPYFPGQDVAKKITLLSDSSGGYVLDAYGGLHPWSVTGKPLPVAIAAYGYWPGQNIARDMWLAPSSTAAAANGYVVDAYGGFHPFWSNGAAIPATITQYPYWSGFDIARGLWFLPNATPSAATGYELDGYGGLHAFASSGQALPPAISQYSYWSGRDIAKSLFGA